MEKIDILKQKLKLLREKWRVFPKSSVDPNWWKYKCDKCVALGLISEIEKLETAEGKLEEFATKLFS